MNRKFKKHVTILILCLLIGVLIAGCGIQGQPGPEDEIEPPGQVKKTEVEEEGEELVDEEDEIIVTDLPPTEEPTPTFTPEPEEKQDPIDPTPKVIISGEKEQMIAKCKADLASRLGISQEQITVVSAEAITWNDSSLGCPEPGGMYLQVLTPGYKIILLANGKEYKYHTDETDTILFCKNISL